MTGDEMKNEAGTDTPGMVRLTDLLGPLPEGDRFADALKFRRLGNGGGDVLYECWGDAVRAYAAQEVAAERERCAHVCACIAAGHAGTARRLKSDVHSAHASGQRDGANECAAAIRRA